MPLKLIIYQILIIECPQKHHWKKIMEQVILFLLRKFSPKSLLYTIKEKGKLLV